MNFIFLLTLKFILLMKNVLCGKYVPSIAFYSNLPIMYMTENGWVLKENMTIQINNSIDIVKHCQMLYPELNITNAIPIYKIETITNWCRKNETCSRDKKYEIRPIYCIDSQYGKQSLVVHSHCKFDTYLHPICRPFDFWRQYAESNCKKKSRYLADMKIITVCKEPAMYYRDVEFSCCSHKGNGFFKIMFEEYLKLNISTHKERESFANVKRFILSLHQRRFNTWKRNLEFNMKRILIEDTDKKTNEKMFENLKKEYKSKYFQFMKWFNNTFMKLDEEHIKRIVFKADKFCNRSQTDSVPPDCVKHLESVIEQLKKHYIHISQSLGSNIIGYSTFLVWRLKSVYRRHDGIFNNNARLKDQYNDTLQYLLGRNDSNRSYDQLFQSEFEESKHQVDKLDLVNSSTNHVHGPPFMSIVVTTVILLILIVITFLVTIIIKYCGQPLRRSSPNYVMSAVFNANQATGTGSMQRADQQLPNVPHRPDVKLNLYENPIFNTKKLSKSIEKQSLIENMEN